MEETSELLRRTIEDDATMNLLIQSQVLVGARVLSFLAVSPFFSQRAMGRTVRIGLMITMSILLVPGVFGDFSQTANGPVNLLPLILKELVLGFVLGMLVWLPIRGLEFAGVLLDTQRGSTMAQDFDVIFNAQTTPTAILLAQIFSGFFFASGGFLMTQQIVFDSFRIWPAGELLPPLTESTQFLFWRFAGVLLFSSIVFALPISGFMFLADVAIAFVARSAPTLNALTFGMPVKSAILLLMLNFYIDVAYPAVLANFADAISLSEKVFVGER